MWTAQEHFRPSSSEVFVLINLQFAISSSLGSPRHQHLVTSAGKCLNSYYCCSHNTFQWSLSSLHSKVIHQCSELPYALITDLINYDSKAFTQCWLCEWAAMMWFLLQILHPGPVQCKVLLSPLIAFHCLPLLILNAGLLRAHWHTVGLSVMLRHCCWTTCKSHKTTGPSSQAALLMFG